MLKLLFFLSMNLSLAFADSHLQAGLDAYQKGDFDAANKEFIQLYSTPKMAFTALFNLGNVAVKLKKPGEALAYYRRAQNLDPRDKDLAYNTLFVNQQFKLTPPPGNISSYEIFRQKILNIFTFNEAALATLVVLVFLLLSLFKFLKLRASSEEVPLPPPALFIWGLLFLVLLTMGVIKLSDTYTARGTIIVPKAELRSGPSESNASLMDIPEGTEVFIGDSASNNSGAWKQVTVPGNLTGWCLDKDVMQTSGEGPW